jgi:hypothetical protein
MDELHAHFDFMAWPLPNAKAGEIEWRLRHGQATQSDLLFAASVMSAYRQMVNDPVKKRQKVVAVLRRLASRR